MEVVQKEERKQCSTQVNCQTHFLPFRQIFIKSKTATKLFKLVCDKCKVEHLVRDDWQEEIIEFPGEFTDQIEKEIEKIKLQGKNVTSELNANILSNYEKYIEQTQISIIEIEQKCLQLKEILSSQKLQIQNLVKKFHQQHFIEKMERISQNVKSQKNTEDLEQEFMNLQFMVRTTDQCVEIDFSRIQQFYEIQIQNVSQFLRLEDFQEELKTILKKLYPFQSKYLQHMQFSPTLKSDQIILDINGYIECIHLESYNYHICIAAMEPELKEEKRAWAIEVLKVEGGISVGVCVKDIMDQMHYFIENPLKQCEGLYLIGGGIQIIHQFGYIDSQMNIQQGDILLILYDLQNRIVKIQNESSQVEESINVEKFADDKFYPCVGLSYLGDKVRILNDYIFETW